MPAVAPWTLVGGNRELHILEHGQFGRAFGGLARGKTAL